MKTNFWLKLKTPLLGCGCLLTAVVAAWAVGTAAVPLRAAEPLDKPVAARSDEAVPAPTAPDPAKPGIVSALVGGREVSVTAADTAASINVVGPTAEVKVGAQMLMVEKTQLVLDGKPLAELPPETKKVEILLAKGMLSIKGDGKEVARAKVGSDALPATSTLPPLKP
ncbi:MAG: hypothetical protein ACO1TE_11400 [Prosthecobacter sp.]